MVIARILLATWLAGVALQADADEVVLAVPLSLQPYFLPVEGRGLAFETIREAFAAGGHSVRPLYVTARSLTGLISDSSVVDCVPMVSPGLQHGWSRTRGLHLLDVVAVTRAGRQINGPDDLRRGRVLASGGAMRRLGEGFRAAVADNREYREISNHRAQIRLLLQGNVDVIVADHLLISWYLDYLHQEGDAAAELAFHDLFEPVAQDFVCRRPEVAAAFDAGLAQLVASGRLAALEDSYGAKRSRPIPSGAAAPPRPVGRVRDGLP